MTACVHCGTELPEAARFCFTCGQPLSTPTCGSCGGDLPAGARFCMTCGTPVGGASAPAAPTPGAPRSAPAGQVASRRLTSILFGDLVGFTTLSETRDPEEVRELLSRYFEECSRIVARYGGTVEKFIGDAVMAVWGVPTAHEDDAERAVRAGLELLAVVSEFGEHVDAPDLAMRVGITTNEVAVTVGATQHGMVAGDAVNTAARIQATATPGQVWVDETTKLLTAAAISFADAGSHLLKGKVQPSRLWSVRAVVAAVGGAQRADGLEAPLVGRDRELRMIKELFHSCEESGRPALLVIDGEAGVGKSRLAWELEKYIDGLTTGVRWHSGRCVAYGEGVAYYALAEAVRGRLRATMQDAPEPTDEEMLAATLDRYVPDDDEREWMAPRLGALLDIGSMRTHAREDLFSAWVTFFERVGGGETVTLVIDDAQHADEGLLMFVEHLLTTAGFGCFVALLTRPGLIEQHPSLATHRYANVLHLATLSDRDVASMLDGLVHGLPEPLRRKLVERSEGVPLFAVETVRSLIDRDLVIPRDGDYVLSETASVDLDALSPPASLHALIAARLDTLSTSQRTVIDRASVLGVTFAPDQIATLCPDVVDVATVLEGLLRLQVLARETSRMSAEFGNYRFVQSALRTVAYGSLSRRDRKQIHLSLVRDVLDAEGDDSAAIRARHYMAAIESVPTDPDVPALRAAAVHNLRRAAHRATSLGTPAEAAKHLLAARDLTDDTLLRGVIGCDLALAAFDAAQWEAAIEHGKEAQAILEERGERVGAGKAAGVVASALALGVGNAESAWQHAEAWWAELRERDDAADARLILTRALCWAGGRTQRDVRDLMEELARLADQVDDRTALGETYNLLSAHYANVGAPSLGLVLLRASADLARRGHDLRTLALTLINLAARTLPDDVSTAVVSAREAVEVSQRAGSPYRHSFALANLALGLWNSGEWAELDRAREAAAFSEFIDETMAAVSGLLAIARGLPLPDLSLRDLVDVDDRMVQGWRLFLEFVEAQDSSDVDDALGKGLQAVRLIHAETGLWDDLSNLWGAVAELAAHHDDADTLQHLTDLVDSTPGVWPLGLRAHRARIRGLVAAREGREEEVEPALREAIDKYATWGSKTYRARAQADLGAWLASQGREAEARSLIEEVRATYTELGAARWVAQLPAAAAHSEA